MGRRPGCRDSERYLKVDSDWRLAKPPVIKILWGGRRGS